MHLIKKIKSYFTKYDWHSWKDFDSNDYKIKFQQLSDDNTFDIVNYIKEELYPSEEIACERHRLKLEKAISCKSIDEVILLMRDVVATDYKETSKESVLYNWEFLYFVNQHQSCANTICISNVLTSKSGNCIYALASIRKVGVVYYVWNHLS